MHVVSSVVKSHAEEVPRSRGVNLNKKGGWIVTFRLLVGPNMDTAKNNKNLNAENSSKNSAAKITAASAA